MALAQEMLKTIADIDALPEGTRAELIDGQLFFGMAPTLNHQDIVSFYMVQFGISSDQREVNARFLHHQLMCS